MTPPGAESPTPLRRPASDRADWTGRTAWTAVASWAGLVALVVVFLLAGAALGILGAFLVPLRVGGVRLPISVLIAIVGNLGLGLLAARGAGSRVLAAVPGVGWLVVVLALGGARGGGDVIIPGDLVGFAFLLTGTIAAAIAVGLSPGPPSREAE